MTSRVTCTREHLDSGKVQRSAEEWARLEAERDAAKTGALAAQKAAIEAMEKAMEAQATVAKQIVDAVAAERAAGAALRSDDATHVQTGNRILAEQLQKSADLSHTKELWGLELLRMVEQEKFERAGLLADRADTTLQDKREARTLELQKAYIASTNHRIGMALGVAGPFIGPVMKALGMSGMPGMSATPDAAAPGAQPGQPGSPQVIQAPASQAQIDEWKAAAVAVVSAMTPATAAQLRLDLHMAMSGQSSPRPVLELLQGVMADAGPELMQRLLSLTSVAVG